MARYYKLDKAVGKCSVPMWMNGCPAGFCDKPAYGYPPKSERRCYAAGEEVRVDGRYSGYVPDVACAEHGGPRIEYEQDGNQVCAHLDNFVNLQESTAGFGDTEGDALADLHVNLEKEYNRVQEEAGR